MSEICKEDLRELEELIDSKLEVIRTQIKGHELLTKQQFDSRDEARMIAANLMDRRLVEMNEIRKQLNDQSREFLSKDVYDSKHELLQKQHDALDKKVNLFISTSVGQNKGLSMAWAWILGGFTLLGIVTAIVLNAIRLFSGKA